MPDLEQKIENKTAVIGVIGLGYVGLPLAIAFAGAGFKVLGFDIEQSKIDAINSRKSYVTDVDDETLSRVTSSGRLEATTAGDRMGEPDAFCICLPTPLTRTKWPDLSFITSGAEALAGHLRPGQLVVLESTTYPGTTTEVIQPILEHSGLKAGRDFYLAFSPERVDPGNKKFTIKNTPKVVGGIDAASTAITTRLYGQIADTVVPVSGAEVAEMVKVFENVFRSVNIALVNELAQLCERMGISVWEVIHTTATKPFGYMPFFPGPGIGGHCIPLDPYYLASRAREYDFHTRFIELAAELNEEMPYYTASSIMEALNAVGKSLNRAKVLVLGVAYKQDISDTRESPSLKLIQVLQEKGAAVSYNDPHVPTVQVEGIDMKSVDLTDAALAEADCVVIATVHQLYDVPKIVAGSKLVFDSRGATHGMDSPKIVRLGEKRQAE